MTQLSMNDGAEALRRFRDAAVELHPDLTHFDQISGDGDFGDNLLSAANLIVAALEEHSDDDAYRVAADVFLDEVGGTSGPLFGLLLQSIASARASNHEDWLRRGLVEGTAAIQRVGEAQPGDRTLVDALVPAAAAEGVTEAARAAASAASETATLRARRGRSSYVGDHALGVPDPGAVGVAVLLWALAGDAAELDLPASVREFLPTDLQHTS